METRSQTHPTERQLAAFALGKLSVDGRTRLERHLADCQACATFLSSTGREKFIAILRQAAAEIPASEQSTPGVRNSATLSNMLTSGQAALPDAIVEANNAPASPQVASAVSAAQARTDDLPQALREQTKYRIGPLLGRGGMGSVYEAFHERMGRRVAIKVINPALVDHPDAIKRFDQEVRAAAQVEHDNVARAYDAEEIGNLRILVMEFVPGQSLDKYVAKQGPLPVPQACRFIQQALAGLNDAHKRGMVHRDLKPQNLMVTAEGKVKILDFGLAKLASEHRGADGLTRENALMGTPHYLAPEQALDAGKADIRADIYSLGCTLYFLLAGSTPFVADTEMKVLLAHQHDTHRSLSEIRGDIPPALSNLVDRMLAKNPADRPQTPIEAGQALTPFLKAQPPATATGPAAKASATPTAPASSGGAASVPLETAAQLETIEVPIGDEAPTGRAARAKTVAPSVAAVSPDSSSSLWNRGRWPILVGGAFFFVLLAWATVVLLRTPSGTIVIHNVPADAEILVDGNTVTLSRNGESLSISDVVKGEHHIKLVRDDRTIWANDLAISFGGETVEATYSPFAPPPAESAKETSKDKNTVDLLKLVKLDEGDALRGKWIKEVDGLHSRGNSLLRLPYQAPGEYDFAIEFTIHKVESGGDVNQICPLGDTDFTWMMGRDGNANCGFYHLSGVFDPPVRHSRPVFETGKRYRSVVSVRRDGITAELDKTGPLRLTAGLSAARSWVGWSVGMNVLGIGSFNDITFHAIECTPVGEAGHVIERLTDAKAQTNAAAFSALSVGGRRSLTDFTPCFRRVGFADLAYNANDDTSPALVGGKTCEQYIVAHSPSSAVYDIPRGTIGFSAVGVGLREPDLSKKGVWRYIVYVDGDEALVSSPVGIDQGEVPIDVPLPRGAKRLELRVDPIGGSHYDHSAWANPQFLFPDEATASVSVQAPAKVEIPKTARRVDLLALVDLTQDVVSGDWERHAGLLVATTGKKTPRFEFPFEPPREYDLRLQFVPRSCEFVGLICVADSKQFVAFVGGWGNQVSGFDTVNGQRGGDVPESPRAPNGWTIVGRSHEMVARVRREGTTLYLDGQLLTKFEGGYKKLGLAQDCALRHGDRLGVRVTAPVEIHAAELFEISGEGKVLRDPQPSARAADSTQADATAATLPEAMQKFPVARVEGSYWTIVGDELQQTSTSDGWTRLWFGDPSWSHYNLTLAVRRDAGNRGIGIAWHSQSPSARVLDLESDRFLTWSTRTPKRTNSPGRVEQEHWYNVRIEARGADFKCFVDGKMVFADTDSDCTQGIICLGAVESALRFKDIKVTSEDDKTILWEGLPKLPGGVSEPKHVEVPASEQRAAKVVRGKWAIEGDELVQKSTQFDGQIHFGDTKWRDYDLSFKAKMTSGNGGFNVQFHVDPAHPKGTRLGLCDFCDIHFGTGKNSKHLFTQRFDGNVLETQRQSVAGRIEPDTWQDVKLEVRGSYYRCFLDEHRVLEGTLDNGTAGRLGLGTDGSIVHFKDIVVARANGGDVLWRGNPTVPDDQLVLRRQAESGSTTPPEANRKFPVAEVVSGTWSIEEEELVQTSTAGEGKLLFGDPSWSRYDLVCRVKAAPEGDGFIAFVHGASPGDYWMLQVNGVGKEGYRIEIFADGKRHYTWKHSIRCNRDDWHDLRIEVRGAEVRFVIDGETIFLPADSQLMTGRIGLGSTKTAVRFRDITVTTEDKLHVLWQGLPKLPQ